MECNMILMTLPIVMYRILDSSGFSQGFPIHQVLFWSLPCLDVERFVHPLRALKKVFNMFWLFFLVLFTVVDSSY